MKNWNHASMPISWLDAVMAGDSEVTDLLIAQTKDQTLQEQAENLKIVQDHLAIFKRVVSDLTEVQDALRFRVIPEKMDEQNLQSMNIRNLGTLYLTAEVLVSTRQAMGPALQEWMRDNGFEDLITEVINASTLGAWVREQMSNGNPVPVDLLNILPRSRAALKKST